MKTTKIDKVKLDINEVLDKLLIPELLQVLSFSKTFLNKYDKDKTKE